MICFKVYRGNCKRQRGRALKRNRCSLPLDHWLALPGYDSHVVQSSVFLRVQAWM